MSFDAPWWLLLLPFSLVISWLIVRHGRRTVPGRQHRWALVARLLALSLIVVALAQPAWARPVDRRAVLFLVDRSASMPAEAIAAQETYLAEALDDVLAEDLAGVAVFGEELRVDQSLSAGRAYQPIRAVIDQSATDIGAALQAAASLLPSEGSRRIILLTDAVETQGDSRKAASDLAEEGIALDVVAMTGGRGADAIVEAVQLPATARIGERISGTVVVRSNSAGPAQLTIDTGDGVQTLNVDLEVGRNEVPFQTEATAGGFAQIAAQLDASFDTRTENDAAEGLVRVLGPAQVAIVEGKAGDADQLEAALAAGGYDVDVVGSVPNDADLLRYDAVMLVNVRAPDQAETERLASFVESLGRGLVVVGGDQSFGLGRYENTALEELLPVRSNPDDLVRRQPVSEVLVIDTSGSMGRCHCREGAFSEGGVNKTDISRAGAALAIEALSSTDNVGVLAFGSGSEWVIPLGPTPDSASVESALGSLFAQGDTEIAPALRTALDELRSVNEGLRHIVLFTDGWDPNEAELLPVAREIADEGITLSVLGTGEGPGSTLSRMAQIGGGRFYAGTDLSEIPEIFVEETLQVARSVAQEGLYLPILGSRSQVTAGLQSAPQLTGYVLTTPKATARLPLLIGQEDPLLATWQRGLGRVTAWTSDATSRWSAGWVGWDEYAPFWGRVVSDVLPPGRESPPSVDVSGGRLEISYRIADAPLDAAGIATIRKPDGSSRMVPLQRTAADTFSASVRVGDPGAYWVAVEIETADGTVASGSSGAVSSYAEEFAFRTADPSLGQDLASITGGRVDPVPTDAFADAPIRGSAALPIWPWLAAAALALFLVDVALRRLVLTEGDIEAWRRDVVPKREEVKSLDEAAKQPEPVEPVAEQATVDRLLRRKRK